MGANPGQEEKIGGARTCRYGGEGFSMTVEIFDSLGVDDVQANGKVTPSQRSENTTGPVHSGN